MIQADDDRNVPYPQAPELIDALRTKGVDFEQIIIPDETHDLLLHQSWVRYFTATADYLDRHLGGRQAAGK